MKHIYKLFISVYSILFIFIFTSFTSLKLDPITEIFKACKAAPVSCGIKLVIKEKSIDMKSFLNSFGINISKGFSIDSSSDYLSFYSNKSSGYLEHLPEEETYILFFESENSEDTPALLRDRALSSVSDYKNFNYYVFEKGSIKNSNIKNKLLNEIKILKGCNITCNDIENGWCAVFKIDNSPYQGLLTDNGKLINYQCALMKYKSGDYLIVGTPIISATY